MSTIVVDGRLTETVSATAESRSLPAFAAFYTANERRLFRALYVMTGDRHDAEDVMQTAFVKVWERWDRVGRLDDPAGYLFRTAFNTQRSKARRAVRSARKLLDVTGESTAPLEPEDVAEARDSAARALQALTPRQRQAVVLTGLLGFSPTEAAGVMAVRPATVRVLVSQARTVLVGTDQPADAAGDTREGPT